MEAVDAFCLEGELQRQLGAFYQTKFSQDLDGFFSRILRDTDIDADPATKRTAGYIRCPSHPRMDLDKRRVRVGGVMLNEKVDESAPYLYLPYPFGKGDKESLEVYRGILEIMGKAAKAGEKFSLLASVGTIEVGEESNPLVRAWNGFRGQNNGIKVLSDVPFLVIPGITDAEKAEVQKWQGEQAECFKLNSHGLLFQRERIPISTAKYLELTNSNYPGIQPK